MFLLCSEEFPAAWMNLGIVEAALGKRTVAMASYRRALKYRPRYAHCYYNMGILVKTFNSPFHPYLGNNTVLPIAATAYGPE